jgi:peptidoglycan-associated lipoprotein
MGGGPGGLAKGSGGSSGGSSGSSFPPLTGSKKGGAGSGDEGGTGDIVIAKADTSDSMRRQTEQMQQEQLATALAGLNDAFFGYDSWKLTEDAKQALEQDANWLKANPNKTLTVEGYCDERGTVAYNLVLGERRAKAARNYLIELGVAPNRVSTVSYGKERPFCKDHEEACHRLNRRAHLVLRTE